MLYDVDDVDCLLPSVSAANEPVSDTLRSLGSEGENFEDEECAAAGGDVAASRDDDGDAAAAAAAASALLLSLSSTLSVPSPPWALSAGVPCASAFLHRRRRRAWDVFLSAFTACLAFLPRCCGWPLPPGLAADVGTFLAVAADAIPGPAQSGQLERGARGRRGREGREQRGKGEGRQ